MSEIFKQLDLIIAQRVKEADPNNSYVAKLYQSGVDRMLKKVGEEAAETLIAAKNQAAGAEAAELIGEVADLWFHIAVMLHHAGLSSEDIATELAKRFGMSGLDEKASRAPTGSV
jgi:phosphoribosyl-ATP pyrophosphohydrolase